MEETKTKKMKIKAGSFQSMGLEKEILQGLMKMGYKEPTPVQRKALPVVLAGLDVVCMARTGSGKTCVFLLPMMQKLKTHQTAGGVRGLILSPTRELANQTNCFALDMAKYTNLRIISVFGGDSIQAQFDALASKPDIIIATPGRLMHLLQEIDTPILQSIQYLVFDEADRLFEMGFAEQLNEIVKRCSSERQTLLFSATLPKMIVQFSRAGLKDPQLIRLDTDIKMSDELRLGFFYIRSNEKLAILLYFIQHIIPRTAASAAAASTSPSSHHQQQQLPPNQQEQTIIFTATKHHSELIYAILQKLQISCTMIYGNMDQELRNSNLRAFRKGNISYLIVTDVAARGIDIPLLNNVINYHFPSSPKLFVHRCGRAARQGRIGFAFSFVEPEELPYMMDVHRFLGKPISTGYESGSASTDGESDDRFAYTLSSMTPDMFHTGLLPQDAIDEENDYIKRLLQEDGTIATLYRIAENGLKQYKRTRTEASRDGLKEAKKVIKKEIIQSIHPLIKGCDPLRCSREVIAKAEFIRKLQTFRPHATVFETGIGTGSTAAHDSEEKKSGKFKKSLGIMKEFRKSTLLHLERNKLNLSSNGASQEEEDEEEENDDLAGGHDDGSNGQENEEFHRRGMNDDDLGEDRDEDQRNEEDEDGRQNPRFSAIEVDERHAEDNSVNFARQSKEKKRLSVAERRKLRKYGSFFSLPTSSNGNEEIVIQQDKGSGSFQDSKYYMAYGHESTQETFAEESLQPLSNLKSGETFGATMLNKAIIDVNPDEAIEMSKKKKLTRWDAKKRKFVKVREMNNSNSPS